MQVELFGRAFCKLHFAEVVWICTMVTMLYRRDLIETGFYVVNCSIESSYDCPISKLGCYL